MTHFRFIPIAAALVSAIVLVACNTAPTTPMASAHSMGTPDHMAKMDAHMKTMRDMREKMMNAKTPEERNKLMAEHMKTMQDGMAMMGGMQGKAPMAGDRGAHHQMTEKRMEMMQMMMQMMMERMPPAPAN